MLGHYMIYNKAVLGDRMRLNLVVFLPSGILDPSMPKLLEKESDFFHYRAREGSYIDLLDGWHRICF